MDLSSLLNPFVFLSIVMAVLVFYSQWFETPRSILRPLPGPRAWPVVGNLLDLLAAWFDVDELHARLARAYGAVVGYRVFGHQVVVISGEAMAREVLDHEHICGRMRDAWKEKLSEGRNVGILSSYGKTWKEHREVVAKYLANILDSGHLDKICSSEATKLVHALAARKDGDAVAIHRFSVLVVTNILCECLFGKAYDFDDRTLVELVDVLMGRQRCQEDAKDIRSLLPSFFDSLPFFSGRAMRRLNTELIDAIGKLMDEHDAKKQDSPEKCLIDVYRQEMEQRWKKMEGNLVTSLTNASLLWTCYDLLTMGVDRTSELLSQALLLIAYHPEVRSTLETHRTEDERACAEEEKGENPRQSPAMSTAQRTFLHAVMLETLRLRVRSACGRKWTTARVAGADVELGHDFDLPQGCIVVAMPVETHQDDGKEKLDEPKKFLPGRWLATGGALVNASKAMPFGAGKRTCPAEAMTSSMFFNLIHRVCKEFTLGAPDVTSKAEDADASLHGYSMIDAVIRIVHRE